MRRFPTFFFGITVLVACPSLLGAGPVEDAAKRASASRQKYELALKNGAPAEQLQPLLTQYRKDQSEWERLKKQATVSPPINSTPTEKKPAQSPVSNHNPSLFSDPASFRGDLLLPLFKPQKTSFWENARSWVSPSSAVLYNRALEALRKGSEGEALSLLRQSLQKDPGNIQGALALASLLQKRGESFDAVLKPLQGQENSPAIKALLTDNLLYRQARESAGKGHYDQAIAGFEKLEKQGSLGTSDKETLAGWRKMALFGPLLPEYEAIQKLEKGAPREALKKFGDLARKTDNPKLQELLKADVARIQLQAGERFNKIFRDKTQEYIDAKVKFKIGGYDTIEVYKNKMAKGGNAGLHGDEYFEKYVDPATWKFRSPTAEAEFRAIGGIDCAGFLQRNWQYLFAQAGIKYPVPVEAKLSGDMLFKQKFMETFPITKTTVMPPAGIKPGDIIRLGPHGDGDWNHFFFFDSVDPQGRVWIRDMNSNGPALRPMPDWYRPYLVGWARYREADKVREKLGWESP